MPNFIENWCDCTDTTVARAHKLHVLSEKVGGRTASRDSFIQTMASHYEDPKAFADRIKRRGYKKAAKTLIDRLPTTKKARSGHIGEILATEIVPNFFPTFTVPIKRLRWNDARNTALRGEDVIAIERRAKSVRFLKGESKSRVSLAPNVVAKARKALDENEGRPSLHAMGFIMNRLLELNQEDLAYVFEDYMLTTTIRPKQVVHMSFGLSGNDASSAYENDLKNYSGEIEQHAMCLQVSDHATFVREAYTDLARYAPNP